MNDLAALFHACDSAEAIQECSKKLRDTDPVLLAGRERERTIRKLAEDRGAELRRNADDETHSICRRFQPGQKVYFGSDCVSDWFDPYTLKMSPNHRYKAGDWAYVWQYQPKSRRLWLCKARKPFKRANVGPSSFSLRDVREYQIDRTELDLRK